jgi:hypothetical protein
MNGQFYIRKTVRYGWVKSEMVMRILTWVLQIRLVTKELHSTFYLIGKMVEIFIIAMIGVSVAGVAAGVAALVVALAMNTGFRQDLLEKLLGAQPHITLLRADRAGEGQGRNRTRGSPPKPFYRNDL